MPSDEKTVVALKTNFLRQQVRILSQPLRLSEKSKQRVELPEGEIQDIMLRANQIARRHNSAVFDRVAISNIAGQIEQLFWFSSEPEDLLAGEESTHGGTLRLGDDLAEPENIERLAFALEDEDRTGQFLSELARLQALSGRRREAERKLKQYRRLRDMLGPLKNPQQNVQPNLVTRDGPLQDELARSKALGIRAAGRVARLSELDWGGNQGKGSLEEDAEFIMLDEGQKLAAVLNPPG